MPNNFPSIRFLSALTIMMVSTSPLLAAAELTTLFTTPQERKLIDANRYKSDTVEAVTVEIEIEDGTNAAMQRLIMEEVILEYKISGITLSQDGPHTVWINDRAYKDGEQLPDKSQVSLVVDPDTRVRITAPDGTRHYATSGEILKVTYLAPIEEP